MILVSSRSLMRHIIRFQIGLIFNTAVAFASPPLSQQEILGELAPFQQMKGLKSKFTQTRNVEKWKVEIVTKGEFSMEKKPTTTVVWEVMDPSYSAIKLSNDQLFIKTQPKEPWQSLENANAQKNMKAVFAWLQFDIDAIKKDFEIKKIKKGHFQFIPKNSQTHFDQIEIFFTKPPKLDRILMTEKSKDSLNLEFSETKISK